jgi:hyaluronan synthase
MQSGAEYLRSTRRSRDKQAFAAFLLAALAVLGFALATHKNIRAEGLHFGMFLGLISLTYLGIKMYFSTRYSSFDNPTPQYLSTAVVIPVYNEDPTAFRACLTSILDQSHPLDEIWVIDDRSPDTTCYEIAREMLATHPGAHVIRAAKNGGKRHAQGLAFRQIRADIYITVDSDTILDRDAVREGLRPFGTDPQIQAVTGNVRVLNWDENVLTRLTTIRYANSFLWERAAYSRLNGSVLCACGALSFWRSSLVHEHLEDYLTQTFLGVEVPYGDDRRLTNYALSKGRVVLQDTALGYTAVPEKWGHYLRQQSRWNKSFFRESLWTLTNLQHNKRVWSLAMAEVGLWVAAFTLLTLRYAWDIATFSVQLPLYMLWFGTMMSYARSVRFLGSQGMTRAQQWSTFLLAPLYWVVTLTLLVPLRFISLMTMKSGSWGTRKKIEVTIREDAVVTVD